MAADSGRRRILESAIHSQRYHSLTLFAPNSEAFDKLPRETLDQWTTPLLLKMLVRQPVSAGVLLGTAFVTLSAAVLPIAIAMTL
jgi:hypothetical protein